MNDESRKIHVNASSLVDLKAELFRKQEAFKQAKLQKDASVNLQPKERNKIWSKANAGVLERAQNDLEAKVEEEDVLKKSRQMLQRKAEIYEKLTQGDKIPDEEETEQYLVNFQRKAVDTILEKKMSCKDEQDAPDDKPVADEDIPPPSGPEEEWVDYVDALGRSRRCLLKDLPELQRMDREFKETQTTRSSQEGADLVSDDMRQDMQRQKWEEEVQEISKPPTGPIHYQDVLRNETWSHGVGYYDFSTDEYQRQKQMNVLKDLREQTVDRRASRERLKAKRAAMLKARLEKVRQRKNIEVVDDEEDKGDDESGDEEKKEDKNETVAAVETSLQDGLPPKPQSTRPWDVGKGMPDLLQFSQKKPKMSHQEYIEQQRTKRKPDFAPPDEYFRSSAPHRPHPRGRHVSQESFFTLSYADQYLGKASVGDEHDISAPKPPGAFLPTFSCAKDPQTMITEALAYFKQQSTLPP